MPLIKEVKKIKLSFSLPPPKPLDLMRNSIYDEGLSLSIQSVFSYSDLDVV